MYYNIFIMKGRQHVSVSFFFI